MNNTTAEAIASRLKSSRKDRKVSQHALAERSGISRNVIASIESGRKEGIDVTEISAISAALDIDPAWLAGFRHDPATSSTYRYTYRFVRGGSEAHEFPVSVTAHAADEALQKAMASVAGIKDIEEHAAFLKSVEEV